MTSYNNDFWNWVNKHRDSDPIKLRLGKKSDDHDWIDDAIAQIENERRSRAKFGTAVNMELIPRLMPVGLAVEQATSARIAKLHYDISGLEPGKQARVLDMTCGLGVDASFLGQHTDTHITAVELNRKNARIATYNFADRPNIEVINADSVEYLKNTTEHFDLIFIDPARRDSTGGRVYNLHDCTPDITTIIPLVLTKSSMLMVKMSPMLDVTQTLRDLPGTRELYVVDERGECRELLAVIGDKPCNTPLITIWNDGTTFLFTQTEEAASTAVTAIPSAGQYLLEPSPATMKAAPFKLLCERFNATMIHPNTHLYTTDTIPTGFPGKVYRINDIQPYSSCNIKSMARQHIKANVAVRNFPISADALRSRLNIKKSGDTRITGITAADSKPYLIFSERIEP